MDANTILAIDYSDVDDAFGPASELGAQLAGVLSENLDERRDAYDALYQCLFHQGSVNAATVRAVPVLVALARDARTPDRAAVLVLLRTVLSASPANRADGFVPVVGLPRAPKASHIAAVVHEVGAACPQLVTLLDDSEGRVRAAAATLVAFAVVDPEAGASVARRLQEALEAEPEPQVLASLALALSLSARRARVMAHSLAPLLSSEAPLTRVAAASALLGADANGISPANAAARTVLAAAGKLDPMPSDDFPWAEGDPAVLACESLAYAAAGDSASPWGEARSRAIECVEAILGDRIAFRDVDANTVSAADVMLAQAMGQAVPTITAPPSPVDLAKCRSLPPISATLLTLGFPEFEGHQESLSRADLRNEQLQLLEKLAMHHQLDAVYPHFGLPLRKELIRWFA